MAQSVKRPTSARVTISSFLSLRPAWGSELIAQSLEPASDSVSPFLSKIKINLKKIKNKNDNAHHDLEATFPKPKFVGLIYRNTHTFSLRKAPQLIWFQTLYGKRSWNNQENSENQQYGGKWEGCGISHTRCSNMFKTFSYYKRIVMYQETE